MGSERLVMVACADIEQARRMAHDLVERRLAACVQIVPSVESVYRWKAQVETAAEVLLLIKTNAESWDALVAAVRALHSYDVPEILAVPIVQGLPEYLQWMASELG
jgi:periplasmic divalent cation tolerance protein